MFNTRNDETASLSAFNLRTIIISIIMFFSSVSFAEPLRIAVASNFTAPMQHLMPLFEKETGQKVQLSFGSSGKFFAQINNGAPYDVFLSADQAKPNKLVAQGLAEKDTEVIYAKGALALWSAKLSRVEPADKVLEEVNKIAIANPKLAPYGKAAEETLKKMGLWTRLQGKLVQGENIGQTYQFVYSQNADVGFVALSQVRSGKIKGAFWPVPASYHSDIKQAAVVLTHSHQQEAAKTFLAFLMRSDIQKKIATFGYQTTH